VKPRSDSPVPTGSAISPFVDQPIIRRPSLVFKLLPWRRPAMWAPVVDAVYAARDFFYGTDDVPTSLAAQSSPAQEPMNTPVAKTPAKDPRAVAETTPAHARLEAAVGKAAGAKAKARDAKAVLKKAKKAFRVARKAAKAERKDLQALQAALTSAEERAAAAAKRARTTRRAPKTGLARAGTKETPARQTRRASSSGHSDAEVVYTEALATPTDTPEGSPAPTSS